MNDELIVINEYSVLIEGVIKGKRFTDKTAKREEVGIKIKKDELEKYRHHFAIINHVNPDEIRFNYTTKN